LSPGERAEIVVHVDRGDDVMLRSFAPDLGMDSWNERFNGGNDTFEILQITGHEALTQSPALPDTLIEIEPLDPANAMATRQLSLTSSSSIDGESMDMERIDQVVEVDSTEIWEISNDHGMVHSFHIHLVHFLILDIDGEAPPDHFAGWKDTVLIPPGSTVRFIAEFRDYSDPEVPYMYHCHILQHEDRGMMGQFVVVEPGNEVPSRIEVEHSHH
jgi:FtsP/CotA-like multicopper oxidase with cupredoxin domain